MDTASFDQAQYKLAQRQSWDSVAAGWLTWWETFEQAGQAVSNHLIDLARIVPGQQVLDIATGIGEPAITAARQVGPTGGVTAFDLSPQMVTIARERAAALDIQNIVFHAGDAEQLDLQETSFDAILSRWGLMFFSNLVPTLDSMRRRLKRGGRLAAAVWSTVERAQVASLPLMVIGRHLQLQPSAPGTPGPFSLANIDTLTNAFVQAGFADVQCEPMTVLWEFARAEDFTCFHQDIAPPIKAMIAHLSSEQQSNIWSEITETARRYTIANGRVQVPGEIICVVGQRQQ